MAQTPFPFDPLLTGITLAYRNPRMIADDVLPRLDPIGKEEFKWYRWTKDQSFTIPDTKVGRKSEPNEIEFTAEELTGATKDYGLDDVIPATDMANAPEGIDPSGRASEGLTDLIMLGREKRVADKVFDASLYAAGNKVTLAGTDQWNDTANSDPIDDIMTGLDAAFVRPNTMVIGRQAWTKLIMHPKMTTAVSGATKNAGVVRRQQVAELFELEEILVGESRLNTAKKGQTPSYSRVWGKHCLLTWKDTMVRSSTDNRVTFGFTVQFGERVSGSIEEPKKGLRGSTRVRVGESVEEIIAAADVAYFIENAIA